MLALIVVMAFRFETANERWRHRQSITENYQFNPNTLGYDKPLRAKSPMKVDQTNVRDYTWAKKEGDYLTETFSTLIPWLVNSGRFDVLDEIRIDLETLLYKYGFKYSELR